MISLRDALKAMEQRDNTGKAIPFSIEFYTADRKKKTGGELVTLENSVLSKNEKKVKPDSPGFEPKESKKQNHWDNSTRNILILSSGQIRKCHIRLIQKFNNQPVYW